MYASVGRIIPECPGMSPGCLRICRTWDLCGLVCSRTDRDIPRTIALEIIPGCLGLSWNVLGCLWTSRTCNCVYWYVTEK